MESNKNIVQGKTKELEPINYYYLATSVIVLIICYYYLWDTGNKLRIKKIERDKIESKTIKVKTLKGDVMMDPNIFEMHIRRMRRNILELNKKFTKTECDDIRMYINNTKSNINSYININTNSIDSNVCKTNSNIRVIDDNILQELELLKNKLTKSTETDSGEDLSNERVRYSMLELLLDLDIILFLVRSSMCKNGVLDLSAIDSLIMELYRNNCMNYSSKIDTKFNKEPSINMNLVVDNNSNNSKKIINSEANRHTTNSQDIEYGGSVDFENNLLKNSLLKNDINPLIKGKDINLISTSHETISEFNNDTKIPELDYIFNIDKLNGVNTNKTFSIFSRDTNIIDTSGRTSLNW